MQAYLQRLSLRLATKMPKSDFKLPMSGIFAVAKPSGPTSMSLVNDVKKHVANSRLFVEEGKLKEGQRAGKGASSRRSKYGREAVKIGQGGTLDPLADGVLGVYASSLLFLMLMYTPPVIGVGKGTKKLTGFLDCVKVCNFSFRETRRSPNLFQEYRTTCLLGCETDSYDSEGAQVRLAPWKHVTREQVESALSSFRGEIYQTPPM